MLFFVATPSREKLQPAYFQLALQNQRMEAATFLMEPSRHGFIAFAGLANLVPKFVTNWFVLLSAECRPKVLNRCQVNELFLPLRRLSLRLGCLSCCILVLGNISLLYWGISFRTGGSISVLGNQFLL